MIPAVMNQVITIKLAQRPTALSEDGRSQSTLNILTKAQNQCE